MMLKSLAIELAGDIISINDDFKRPVSWVTLQATGKVAVCREANENDRRNGYKNVVVSCHGVLYLTFLPHEHAHAGQQSSVSAHSGVGMRAACKARYTR